uniref:GAB2 n=1 Tax=Echinostoma caproni TaxID=27848 RepID=A0A183BER7_9TREM
LDSNIDSGCLSLKNPLNDAPLEFFQAPTTKHENFYMANASVVDSPCPLLGRTDPMNRRVLLKTTPGVIHGSSESVCSPHGSFQLLHKPNPMCLLEKTPDGRLVLSDRSISPMYTPVLRRGSLGDSPELVSFFSRQRNYTPQNRYKDSHGEAVHMGPDTKMLFSNASSHYSTASNMRENSLSPYHNSPLFIYNKCYPNESTGSTQCFSPIRPCLPMMTSGLPRGKPSSPQMKKPLVVSVRELSSFGTDQPIYLSRFQNRAIPADVAQSDRCSASPYLVQRSAHPSGNPPIRPNTRPVCASQLMQRRDLSMKGEMNKFSYDTGSLKMPYPVQSASDAKNPTGENNHLCPLSNYHDGQCVRTNNLTVTDSASLTSSELCASQELTQTNVLQRRPKMTTNNLMGSRPVGIINDVLLGKVSE